MDRVLDLLSLNRVSFHELSMRGRVLLTQLPFFVVTLILTAGLWFAHEPLRTDPRVPLSLALTVALTGLCLLVPWERLPDGSFLVIPVLDFVPLTLLREATTGYVTGVGVMAAFPVIWFAASGRLTRAAAPLGFLLTLAMVWIPLLAGPGRPTAAQLSAQLLIPFMLLGIGFTVQVLSNSMDRQKAELEAKDAELRRLLDATARRERLLDTILDTVDVGVLAIDADGHDVRGNRTQRSMHRIGVPPGAHDAAEAELLVFGDDGVTPMPAADRPAARAVRGESFSDQLIRIGLPPLQRVYSISARAMRDQDGRPEGSVLTFTDVTDLVAALQAKDDFLAGVSHELRTPLTSIRGYTELLAMDEELPGPVHAGLEVIERNADQLLVLVEDLLGTAGSALELQLQRADLVQVVQQSVSAAELRAADAGVELRVEAPPRLSLLCDSVRIGQVLDNLLSNAIKYSPGGGPITVRVVPAEDAVQVQVADRGMGMRSEDAEKVFSRFFRSQNARMSAIPGLGLGLAVAQEIVRLHGGSIRCDSELGEGTVFTAVLPLGRPAGAHAVETEPARLA